MRVVVIGAGPVGLVAALGAIDRGHDVTVLEAGEVGENLRRWGATRAFSPLAMNLPPRVLALLSSGPAAGSASPTAAAGEPASTSGVAGGLASWSVATAAPASLSVATAAPASLSVATAAPASRSVATAAPASRSVATGAPASLSVATGAPASLSVAAPPVGSALLTGPELADRVLRPLAARAPLAGRVRTRARVIAVGRARMGRGELAGHPLRGERPFRVLVETPAGEEVLEADRVLDASGVYGQPQWMGPGGMPARGERAIAARVVRDLGQLAARSVQLVGRNILLVGHGHSAANALGVLDELARAYPATRLTWAVRTANARPCAEVADDPLPERRAVAARANELAQSPPAHLTVERRAHVEAVAEEGERLAVELSGGRRVVVDEIVSLTGYRPDLGFLSELALEIAPSTEGAARLERAIANVTDCLTVPKVGAADLGSGEPGFWLIGHKSYGRAKTFLLSTGFAQLETILDGL